jgi:hypothetical protein
LSNFISAIGAGRPAIQATATSNPRPYGRYPHGITTLTDMMMLPGADLVERGVADLDAGRESAEALLVSIGAPRLRSVGLELPPTIASPEHKLYLLLAGEKGDAAHSAYNALIRRLVSFERAAACAN